MKNRRKYLEWVVYAVGGLYGLLFVSVAIARLVYPYEVEWNEGAVLDHAIRIVSGQPVYTAPSLSFGAFIYTPFYYYVVALLMKIGGIGIWAGRSVSIVATLLTSWIVGRIVFRETRSALFGVSGAMLYLAFYHGTGFYYDIVRMDALAICLAVASIYSALYLRRGYVMSALLIALAYFTKQQMIFFLPAMALWFALRDRKAAIWFTLISVGLIVATSIALNIATHGWYAFYTLTVPGMKARTLFSWTGAIGFIPYGVFGVFSLSTIVIVIAATFRAKTTWANRDNVLLLALCYLCGLVSTCISTGNAGGYTNVFMSFTAIIAIVFPIAAHIVGVETTTARIGFVDGRYGPAIATWLLLFEFASFAYNPMAITMLVPSAKHREAGDRFIATLRTMPGEVWTPYHGYLGRLAGKTTYIHIMAMNDALIPNDSTARRFHREIDSAYSSHKFGAIVLDENKEFALPNPPHYLFSGKIFDRPNIFLSRYGDIPTRPQFVYVPEP